MRLFHTSPVKIEKINNLGDEQGSAYMVCMMGREADLEVVA